MDFLTFLESYEGEDVSKTREILSTNKEKEDTIIKEAFNGEYTSQKEAILNLENYFISEDTAPKGVDIAYVVEHMDELKDKIENMTEGDIKIIIHNHETADKPAIAPLPSISAIEVEEGAKKKRGRGRPKKNAVEPEVDAPVAEDAEEDIKDIKDSIDKIVPVEEKKDEEIEESKDEKVVDETVEESKDDVVEESKDEEIEESKDEEVEESVEEVEEDEIIVKDDDTESDDADTDAVNLEDEPEVAQIRWSDIEDKLGELEDAIMTKIEDEGDLEDAVIDDEGSEEVDESDADQLVMKPKGEDLKNELDQKGDEKDEMGA